MFSNMMNRDNQNWLTGPGSPARDLSEIMRTAIHDMRSPLQALVLMASLDDRHMGAGELRTRIMSITLELQRQLDTLVRECTVQDGPEPFHANAVIESVLAGCGLQERIELLIPQPLPVIRFPQASFARIIRNLLVNSAEHSGKHPCRVTITWSHRGDTVEFRYSDNGSGFSEQQWNRADIRRAAGTRGNGLGIIREAIMSHGGTASLVHTAPGWFFNFRIPD